MRTCYLHAGMPKTGSTSIQKAFVGYESDSVRYADLGHANHGEPLISAFSDKPEDFYIFRNRGLTEAQCANMAEEAMGRIEKAASSTKNVIFSSEAIVDHLKPSEIDRMISFLKAHSERIQVIIYVRPFASLVSSQMQERIKSGANKFIIPVPMYRKRFEPFIKGVGRKNVEFIRFDREDLRGRNVVTDFATRIGVEAPEHTAEPANETLSVQAIGTIYAFNKYVAPALSIKTRTVMRNNITRQVTNLPGPKFSLHESLIAKRIDRLREDLEWAEATCGFDVRGELVGRPSAIRSEQDLLSRAGQLKQN